MNKKKRWFLAIAIVVAAGLSYMVYALFIHSAQDYLTVTEAKLQAKSLSEPTLQVGGRVVSGSIDWDNKSEITKFVLTDDRESVKVVYQGTIPDNFKPGASVVVAGSYQPNGDFKALAFVSRRSVCNLCHS